MSEPEPPQSPTLPQPQAQSEPSAATDPAPTAAAAPPTDLADMLAGPDLPTEEVLERADAKPPRYRLVRGAIYTTYMVLVAWFCIGVTVAVYRAVWGPDGQKLQAQEAKNGANLKNCKE